MRAALLVPSEMGVVFGLATVTLTVGMNFALQLYRRLSPVSLALAVTFPTCPREGHCVPGRSVSDRRRCSRKQSP